MRASIKGFLFGLMLCLNLLAIGAGWFVLKTIDKGQHIQFIKSGCGIDSLLEANERR
jgi:hypothetical protein